MLKQCNTSAVLRFALDYHNINYIIYNLNFLETKIIIQTNTRFTNNEKLKEVSLLCFVALPLNRKHTKNVVIFLVPPNQSIQHMFPRTQAHSHSFFCNIIGIYDPNIIPGKVFKQVKSYKPFFRCHILILPTSNKHVQIASTKSVHRQTKYCRSKSTQET